MKIVQREITPKVGKPELYFMCSAHPLRVLYIGVKLRENISKWYQSYGADMKLCSAKGQTLKFRWYNIIMYHFLWWGIKNMNT